MRKTVFVELFLPYFLSIQVRLPFKKQVNSSYLIWTEASHELS